VGRYAQEEDEDFTLVALWALLSQELCLEKLSFSRMAVESLDTHRKMPDLNPFLP